MSRCKAFFFSLFFFSFSLKSFLCPLPQLRILIPFEKEDTKAECPPLVAVLTPIKAGVKLIPLYHFCGLTANDHTSPLSNIKHDFFCSTPTHLTGCPFHPVNIAVSFYPCWPVLYYTVQPFFRRQNYLF